MNDLINEKIIIELDVLSDHPQHNISEILFSDELKEAINSNRELIMRYIEISLKEKIIMLEKHIFEMSYFVKHVTYIDANESKIQRKRYGLMKIYNIIAKKSIPGKVDDKIIPAHIIPTTFNIVGDEPDYTIPAKFEEAPVVQPIPQPIPAPVVEPIPVVQPAPIPQPIPAPVVEQVPEAQPVFEQKPRWNFKKKPITKEGIKRIGKIELTDIVAKKFEMPKIRAKTFISLLFEEIALCLINDEQVWLKEFGNFLLAERDAREGLNPLTGEKLIIPATTVVKFKSSSRIKEALNPEIKDVK